jgi:hypothetical protein
MTTEAIPTGAGAPAAATPPSATTTEAKTAPTTTPAATPSKAEAKAQKKEAKAAERREALRDSAKWVSEGSDPAKMPESLKRRAEKQAMKNPPPIPPSRANESDDAKALRANLAARDAEIEKLRGEAADATKSASAAKAAAEAADASAKTMAIRSALVAAATEAVDPSEVATLLADSMMVAPDGKIIAKANADHDVKRVVADFLRTKPHHARARIPSGTGAPTGQAAGMPPIAPQNFDLGTNEGLTRYARAYTHGVAPGSTITSPFAPVLNR